MRAHLSPPAESMVIVNAASLKVACSSCNLRELCLPLGFSDKERDAPPPVGATIVFRYQELSDGGVPRFPTFASLRDEV